MSEADIFGYRPTTDEAIRDDTYLNHVCRLILEGKFDEPGVLTSFFDDASEAVADVYGVTGPANNQIIDLCLDHNRAEMAANV